MKVNCRLPNVSIRFTVHWLVWFSQRITWTLKSGIIHPGVALIAKFLRKYCNFGCHTHFGHITTSPYAKWLNIDSASYGSLVAATSLNTRSICKLRVISAVAPHSSPALQIQSMKGGIWSVRWNKCASCIILVWWRYPPRPPTPSNHWSMHVIVGSALSACVCE